MGHERERVDRLLKAAAELGFRNDGYDGRGHIRLIHANGERYQLGATPGDWHGDNNAIADMERISGRKLPRVNHRRSRKAVRGSGFRLDRVARESVSFNGSDLGQQIAAARTECDKHAAVLADICANPTRTRLAEFSEARRQWVAAADFLSAHHQPVPPDPCREIA